MANDRQAGIETADDLARRAAFFLTEEYPAAVPEVEAALQTRGADREPERFDPTTMIALGILIVEVAKFAYTIWRDRQKDQQLAADALKRRVRLELADQGYPDTAQRAKVIDAVVRAVQQGRG